MSKSNYISNEDFIEMYTKGLKLYLDTRIKTKSHIVDIAVENAAFAEAFFIVMDVSNQ